MRQIVGLNDNVTAYDVLGLSVWAVVDNFLLPTDKL
jgi:hypothetical protein